MILVDEAQVEALSSVLTRSHGRMNTYTHPTPTYACTVQPARRRGVTRPMSTSRSRRVRPCVPTTCTPHPSGGRSSEVRWTGRGIKGARRGRRWSRRPPAPARRQRRVSRTTSLRTASASRQKAAVRSGRLSAASSHRRQRRRAASPPPPPPPPRRLLLLFLLLRGRCRRPPRRAIRPVACRKAAAVAVHQGPMVGRPRAAACATSTRAARSRFSRIECGGCRSCRRCCCWCSAPWARRSERARQAGVRDRVRDSGPAPATHLAARPPPLQCPPRQQHRRLQTRRGARRLAPPRTRARASPPPPHRPRWARQTSAPPAWAAP